MPPPTPPPTPTTPTHPVLAPPPRHSPPPAATPTPPAYFDYTRAAREANLTPDALRSIITLFERDYPYDVMLRELHVLRACNAILRGTVSLRDVLSTPGERAA